MLLKCLAHSRNTVPINSFSSFLVAELSGVTITLQNSQKEPFYEIHITLPFDLGSV